ncbi:FkbM family methyltransferase [Synechococcus sp. CS-1328]|uniref:FkbM family methyltransferase n=1 Tax=Synechococcus sp. CS-1328 TaxID=2847976 RepID=UPI00223C1130|nr:FkbM family methyltransferase [Synechococcus sp. CS-1328]
MAKEATRQLGYDIISQQALCRLQANAEEARELPPFARLWAKLSQEKREAIGQYLAFSKAQLAQDLFALSELADTPYNSYFVEFGATDGVSLSNTWMFEKVLGWKGLLAEPALVWHERLQRNRSCSIDLRCVSDQTGKQVEFLEVDYPELSTVAQFANSGDWASQIRMSQSSSYRVETVSLNDLLDFHKAPSEIGYLSVDTEGSEYGILSRLDFDKRAIRVITVEHNYCETTRAEIFKLLSSKGYERRHIELSQWDDWYVLR